MDNYYYPVGADTPDAPWNQTCLPKREVEVRVLVTLSKTIKVLVDDYNIEDCGKDEDGFYYEDVDYSECNLEKALKEQVVLPQEAYVYVENSKAYKDLVNWHIDELECSIEE